jgi:capsid protein
MVPHLQEGESITPFAPTSPGGQYEPFITAKTRGIGAGVGMSGSQLLRYSGDASFSSARQDLIEDWREYQQEQDNLASDIVIPVYLTWFNLAVLEGRFDGEGEFDADAFLANPRQYTAVKTVGPRRPWIDPEKEANAYVILLKNSLITREEIMAECGKQFADEIVKMAEESQHAKEVGVTLIEDAERKDLEADAAQKNADAKAKLRPPPAPVVQNPAETAESPTRPTSPAA